MLRPGVDTLLVDFLAIFPSIEEAHRFPRVSNQGDYDIMFPELLGGGVSSFWQKVGCGSPHDQIHTISSSLASQSRSSSQNPPSHRR